MHQNIKRVGEKQNGVGETNFRPRDKNWLANYGIYRGWQVQQSAWCKKWTDDPNQQNSIQKNATISQT